MTDRQRLWRVELPLAAPVIMAGVRTAAVWTIGAATLSTPVGQTSLGDYIFAGLQTENWAMVLIGCVASAVLALVVDQLLGLVERGAERRDRRLWGAGLLGLAVGLAVAVAPLAADLAPRPARYVIGAKNFSEQYILAELMADRLEGRGATVDPQDQPRLGGGLPRLGRRRDRRLCRLFRHAVGQRPGPQGQPRPPGGAGRPADRAEAPRRRRAAGAAGFRERLRAAPCAAIGPRRWGSGRWPISPPRRRS